MLNLKEIGQNIENERIAQGYSQQILGKQIGYSRTMISKLENGTIINFGALIDVHIFLNMEYLYIVYELKLLKDEVDASLLKTFGENDRADVLKSLYPSTGTIDKDGKVKSTTVRKIFTAIIIAIVTFAVINVVAYAITGNSIFHVFYYADWIVISTSPPDPTLMPNETDYRDTKMNSGIRIDDDTLDMLSDTFEETLFLPIAMPKYKYMETEFTETWFDESGEWIETAKIRFKSRKCYIVMELYKTTDDLLESSVETALEDVVKGTVTLGISINCDGWVRPVQYYVHDDYVACYFSANGVAYRVITDDLDSCLDALDKLIKLENNK